MKVLKNATTGKLLSVNDKLVSAGKFNSEFSQFTLNSNSMSIEINVEGVKKIFLTWSNFGLATLNISTYQISALEITKINNSWIGYYHLYKGNGNWACNGVNPNSTQYIKSSESNNILTLTSISLVTGGRFNVGSYDVVKVY